MPVSKAIIAVCAMALVGALVGACEDIDRGLASEPNLRLTMAEAPPGAAPGTCWGKHVTPAVLETVTEQIVLQPAQIASDGKVLSPTIYKTETRQAIVQERHETWFETPCADVQTAEFISTLQRALQARGMYRGMITGQMDSRTRAAVRRFQAPDGLDSGILSLAAARKLGIVALDRAEVAKP